jgi:hypothetical protein
MSDTTSIVALRHAVITSAFSPEAIPERVAAAGILAIPAAGSPSRLEFLRWGVSPSRTTTARQVAELVRTAYAGSLDRAHVEAVGGAFGDGGVVAAVGIAAAARMFDAARSELPTRLVCDIGLRTTDDESRPTLIRIRRSFEQVPQPWAIMAWQPRSLTRWWDLHEAVMAPALLTADEKWLAMIAAGRALGLDALAERYSELLLGWEADEIDRAIEVASVRVRRGVGSALVSLSDYSIGSLQSDRFELAAAAMPADRAREFRDIVDLATGLAVFNSIS